MDYFCHLYLFPPTLYTLPPLNINKGRQILLTGYFRAAPRLRKDVSTSLFFIFYCVV